MALMMNILFARDILDGIVDRRREGRILGGALKEPLRRIARTASCMEID